MVENSEVSSKYLLGYIFGSGMYSSSLLSQGKNLVYQGQTKISGATYPYRAYKIPDSLSKVTITDSDGISANAFYNMKNIVQIIVNENNQFIGNGAFYNVSSLTSIVIPNSVTSIGSYAFYGAESLLEIHIPNTVIKVEENAFGNATELTIYADFSHEPNGWHSNWNSDNRPVIWS